MLTEFPVIPVGPILEHYGSDEILDDWNHHPIKCPFHGDRSPSATVTTTEDEQYFRCHVCDMRGNAAQLIMKKEGVGFWDAVERAKRIIGGSSPELLEGFATRTSLPREARNRSSYSEFKRTWLRDRSHPGA